MSKATGWRKMLSHIHTRYKIKLGCPPKCTATCLVDGAVVECGRPIEVGDWYYRVGNPGKGRGRVLCPECATILGFPSKKEAV